MFPTNSFLGGAQPPAPPIGFGPDVCTLSMQGFQKLQDMIFSQLNEKMKAMDRSLLEKIAADIEMMDKEQGKASKINKNSYYSLFKSHY